MDNDTSTTGASGENQATGSSAEGATGGSQDGAGTLAAGERESYESRIRSFQSEADRAKARSAELERQLAEVQTPAAPAVSDDGTFDPTAFAAQLYADFERRNELAQAAASLRGEFEFANPGLFQRASEFDSVESLRAAAEADHARVKALVDARAEAKEQALRAEMAEKYGIRLDSPAGGEGNSPAGDPTVEEFARLSFAEQARLEAENPGITDRILRSAMT